MPRHATKTSFKEGQKYLNGRLIGSWNKNRSPWNKGKKLHPLTEDHKNKISLKLKGRTPHWLIKNMKINCVKCGISFITKPHKLKNGRKFCSYARSNSSRPEETRIKAHRKTTLKNKQNGLYKRHSIRMLNGGALKALKQNRRISKFQIEVFNQIKNIDEGAVLEYQIKTSCGVKAVDIFAPTLNLCFECDGDYWHRNTTIKDLKRQKLIEEQGYKVIRIKEGDWYSSRKIQKFL